MSTKEREAEGTQFQIQGQTIYIPKRTTSREYLKCKIKACQDKHFIMKKVIMM